MIDCAILPLLIFTPMLMDRSGTFGRPLDERGPRGLRERVGRKQNRDEIISGMAAPALDDRCRHNFAVTRVVVAQV